MMSFSGLIGTPATPLTAEGEIDEQTYRTFIDFVVASRVDAVSIPMHVGESVSFTPDERKRLTEIAVGAVDGRVPVLIHVSQSGTRVAADLAAHAAATGASGIVCAGPYYWAAGPDALAAHFAAVAGATELPLVLYNSPKVGPVISPAVLADVMRAVPSVVGMKDASLDLRYFAECARVGRAINPEFTMFAGTDYTLSTVMAGGNGAFSLFGQLAPNLTRRLYDRSVQGDVAGAKVDQANIDRLWGAVRGGYPAGIKAALEVLGRPVGPTRLPIIPYTARQTDELRARLDQLEFMADEPRGWTHQPNARASSPAAGATS